MQVWWTASIESFFFVSITSSNFIFCREMGNAWAISPGIKISISSKNGHNTFVLLTIVLLLWHSHFKHLLCDFAATDVDAAHISAVACSTAEKLMSEFPKFFPSISSLSSDKTYCSPLAADLSRGLFCMLDDRRYNSFPTKLYPSSSVCRFFS